MINHKNANFTDLAKKIKNKRKRRKLVQDTNCKRLENKVTCTIKKLLKNKKKIFG